MTVWIHSPFDNLPQEGFRRQRYWLMAEAFAAEGHSVVYWTGDFNHGTKARRILKTPVETSVELKILPVRPYRRNVSFGRVLSHLLLARRLKKELVGRPDLIISATPTLGAATVLLDYAKAVGARFVIDIQDAWPETFERLGLPHVLLAPLARLAKRLYREADGVTGVSERYRAIAGRDDYAVFYHGILPVEPVAEPAETPTRLLYLGNLGAGYDLNTVLRALAKNERLTLDIAGKGPREAELKALVAKLGLSSRVRFWGYLGAADLRARLAAADVGLIPMRDDSWVGLPYKLGDYLAAGLPVLSSLHGECGRLLGTENLGATYEFGSSESLLAALGKVPTRRVSLPESLRADLIYRRYVAFIRKVIS